MTKVLVQLGSISGILGALICFIAGLSRFLGFYYLAGYQSTTVFNVGIGLMVFACLMKLETLTAEKQKP